MEINHRYRPFRYYFWTLLITWAALFTAAWLSHREELASYQFLPMMIGLLAPFGVAMFMIFGSKDKGLVQDFKKRLFNLRLIRSRYWLPLLLIMPFATLTATAISLLFGQPVEQFRLSPEFTLAGGQAFTILIVLFLAPAFEELGWRGYGGDSLNKKGRSLMTATLLFAVLWNLWHLPLFFIKGYYQYELFQTNVLYALNFVVSLFPAVVVMNWLFYKSNRSIIAIILFHFMMNLFSVLFQTEQFTKCIITVVMACIAGFIIWRERRFFFGTEEVAPAADKRELQLQD
ncbi:MAG: CPBP family intramembrane metalloprotease [Phaeodactylibacter sp.]|nr:CPBP family intramembrane metalloprotease [Phaeodactylibacter sp.]